nr:MAG TPA: hypothetical protein [Bacteriophage sp.]
MQKLHSVPHENSLALCKICIHKGPTLCKICTAKIIKPLDEHQTPSGQTGGRTQCEFMTFCP